MAGPCRLGEGDRCQPLPEAGGLGYRGTCPLLLSPTQAPPCHSSQGLSFSVSKQARRGGWEGSLCCRHRAHNTGAAPEYINSAFPRDLGLPCSKPQS